MAREKKRRKSGGAKSKEIQPISREQKRIMTWLKDVRFQRQFFGGVRERDVWKKIEELNNMYNLALLAERARYDALLESRAHGSESAGADANEDREREKRSQEERKPSRT